MAFIHRTRVQADRLRSAIGQRGAPTKTMRGTWISDLAALGKAIVLCEMCVRKWDPARHGYESKDIFPGQKFVLGECDACGVQCQGTLHIPVRSS